MNRRIYFITPTNVADHRHGGASICSLAYLQALAEIAPGRLTLVSPCRRESMPELPGGVDEVIDIPARGLASKAKGLMLGTSVDRLSPFVDRLLDRLDLRRALVFMNSSRGGRFSRRLWELGIPSITLFHNIEAEFFGASERGIIRHLKVRAADRNDRLAFAFSAGSIFLSRFDADLMRSRASQEVPGSAVIEEGFFAPKPGQTEVDRPLPTSQRKEILLNCSLGIAQNRPGVGEFLNAWKAMQEMPGLADASLVLAGSRPTADLLEAARSAPRVTVVPDPSDQEMESLFARCRVCVSTIDAGSGIKVRIAEALRRGRPIVATPHSCIGYEAIDPRVLRRSAIRQMAPLLADILEWPTPGELETLARREFQQKLAFSVGKSWLSSLIDRVDATPRP